MGQGLQATESKIALARVCVLSLVVSFIMFVIYVIIASTPKILNKIAYIKTRKEFKKYEK